MKPPQGKWQTSTAPGSVVGDERLRVEEYRSIHEVDERLWDSLVGQTDLFRTHRFIRVVQDSSRETEFWHLLIYRRDMLVATATLFSCDVHLDLFMGPSVQRAMSMVRKFLPSFFSLRLLFCGLPVSIGKRSVTCSPLVDQAPIMERLVREMVRISREHSIRFLGLKEFRQGEEAMMQPLIDSGFIRAASLPYAALSLRWRSFGDYLGSMRHGYRRHIRKSLRKLVNGMMVIEKPEIRDGQAPVCSPKIFHNLYLEVMQRAPVKLETLSLSFFEHVYKYLANEALLISIVQDGKVLGAALCTLCGERMTFLLVGLDYERRDSCDVYFNLVYGITNTALERECSILELGQTSYWMKSRIGAEVIPEYFFIRAENTVVHALLRLVHPLLFPKVHVPQPRVFRT